MYSIEVKKTSTIGGKWMMRRSGFRCFKRPRLKPIKDVSLLQAMKRYGQETGKYIASKLWKLRPSMKVRSGDLNIYSIEVKKNFGDRVFSQTNLFWVYMMNTVSSCFSFECKPVTIFRNRSSYYDYCTVGFTTPYQYTWQNVITQFSSS